MIASTTDAPSLIGGTLAADLSISIAGVVWRFVAEVQPEVERRTLAASGDVSDAEDRIVHVYSHTTETGAWGVVTSTAYVVSITTRRQVVTLRWIDSAPRLVGDGGHEAARRKAHALEGCELRCLLRALPIPPMASAPGPCPTDPEAVEVWRLQLSRWLRYEAAMAERELITGRIAEWEGRAP